MIGIQQAEIAESLSISGCKTFKPLFPYGHNCRERVVTVVRVVFATKRKHEEKLSRDTLATVHDSYRQCR
jgi:hypothetical protein